MKKTKKLISLILAVTVILTANFTNVYAANVCKMISGSARAQKKFTIKTDKYWITSNKVTLTQSAKGTAKGKTWTSTKTKYYKIWGHYKVYVTDSKGKTKVSNWTDKNFTIKGLKKNSKYTVKVVPYANNSIHVTWAGIKNGGFYGWKNVPCWNVRKTSGITLCS